MAFKVFLEINISNFNANTVKVLFNNTEVILATNGMINEFKAIKLFQNGILTVAGQVQKGEKIEEQIALIYKGETIIQGNKNTFKEAAKKIVNTTHNEKKLLGLCEEIINRRRFVSLENVELLGSISKTGAAVKIKIIDELGNFVGELSRANQKSNILSYHFIKNGKKIDLKSSVGLYSDSSNNGIVSYLINKGEHLIYGDLNFPIDINNKFSGLGNIILDDALHYFIKKPKFESVDGIATLWTENKIYADYGGSSLNLQQFWKNVKEGKMTYEQAALNTFTGKWAKENGFSKVRIKIQEDDILLDEVRLVILKNK